MYQIKIFKVRPEVDVAGYPPAYPARTGSGQRAGCCIAVHADDVHEVM